MFIRICHARKLLFILNVVLLLHLMKQSGASNTGAKNETIRCIDKEKHALLHLNPSSANSSCDSLDCCQWLGVYCSKRTNRIYRLDLSEFLYSCYDGLSPQRIYLDSSLLALEDLRYLDLSGLDNSWFGQIPSFIGSFSKLTHLYFSSELSGTIPPELGNLTMLQSLEIRHDYYISSSPENWVQVKELKWLLGFSYLQHLVLNNVDLRRATDWIHVINKLPALAYLDLHGCHLPNVGPGQFFSINSTKSLVFADLSSNKLWSSSVWFWIFNHTSLTELNLADNQLRGHIVEKFRNLTSLTRLDLSFNQLEVSLPGSLEGLCGLRILQLARNKLAGDVSSVFQSVSCARESLMYLALHNNYLRGSLPDITEFSALKTLTLQSNKLDGTLPSSFRRPSRLVILKLHGNQLTGLVPDLSVFRLLKVLQLQINQLNGTLHTGIGQIASLETIDISSNNLSGEISEEHFSKCSRLRYLDLSFNSLTINIKPDWVPPFRLDTIGLASCKLGSPFPKWLRTQSEYSRLDLSSAGISGVIPLWFWNLSSRATFIGLSHNELHATLPSSSETFPVDANVDLSSNFLHGAIPSFLAKALYLNLSRNSFSGPITFLCQNLTNYNIRLGLDLSHNFLSGKLPDCWKDSFLGVLDLSYNSFHGNLPSSFGLSTSLVSLHLTDNRFSGNLPSFFRNFTELFYLDLGGNQFSGQIPRWIGDKLQKLMVLSLRNNSFSGGIPEQLCRLSSLQILDLSMNDISGVIPRCLCNLKAMALKLNTPAFISDTNGSFSSIGSEYKDYVSIALKGFIYEYKNQLELVKAIDLSSNKLRGVIPSQISCLVGLVSLNLSRNVFNGTITSNIGHLSSLESLDLSNNHFSGSIPASLSSMNFLTTLDLADNNLSGRIPMGTQIQGFSPSVFEGNTELCGEPLSKKCPGDKSTKTGGSGGGNNHIFGDDPLGLIISVILGFITGFWVVCGVLVFKKSWRYTYFRFCTTAYDRICMNK